MICDRITVGNLTAIIMPDIETIDRYLDYQNFESDFGWIACNKESVFFSGPLSGMCGEVFDVNDIDSLIASVEQLENKNGCDIVWAPTPIENDVSIHYISITPEEAAKDYIAKTKRALKKEINDYDNAVQCARKLEIYSMLIIDEDAEIVAENDGIMSIEKWEKIAVKYMERNRR